jgi:hypothetical protein
VVALDDSTLDEAKTPKELGLDEGATLVVWRVASTRANRSNT